ncbi:MAG: VCBS repeat-containing protein [Chloracidobacterium sp.]|nr:VCBS repeat-containing protein [Chloracidobacterium sp.]
MKQSEMSFIKFDRKAILLLGVVVSLGFFGIVASHSSATGSSFATWVDYATGQAPFSVVVADFNGDGQLDLAVANHDGNTVSILLGIGHGTFVPNVDYPTGTGPFSVALGDFNGDGNLDLAVANQTSNNVSILLGTGTGTFTPKVDYPAGANSVSVAVGDFNGDGKSDLAVANYNSDNVSILLGTGTGTFAPKVDYATGHTPLSVTVGDFNGDGKPDLVVTAYYSVSVLLGADGGTFSPKIDYNFPPGYDIEYLAVRDLNGDGKLDLAVATGQTVAILLGTGGGTFTGEVDYPTAGATGVAIGDFDGDGNPDLAIGSRSDPNVSVLPGNGDGTFGAFVFYRVNFNPRSIAVGDFNDDGKPDLVSTAQFTNTVSVLLNTAIFPSPTPATYCGEITGRISDSGGSLSQALVQACDSNNLCAFNSSTDAAGNYRILGLPPNTSFDLTVNPPSYSTDLPAQLSGRSVQSCDTPLVGQNAVLVTPGPPPPGTDIQPSYGEIPVVYQGSPLLLSTTQASGGSASYTIGRGGSIFSSGPMPESPNGFYSHIVPPLAPAHGPAAVTITIIYLDNTVIHVTFDIYIDPSGVVQNTMGQPIQGATVTLYRSDIQIGAYAQVADGNAVMSPANRHNPDMTNADGKFGWDVLAGYYKVRAQKSGCNAPGNPSQPFVETAALPIPPPVTDLVLTLECAVAASPTPTATSTPQPAINGTVTYGNAIGNPNPRFVSNVFISGSGSSAVSTTTTPPGVGAGTYLLSGFGAGAYTVTPTKSTGQNSITSFDAAKIAEHVAGTSLLTGNQLVVADVTGNGQIQSFDAARIAQYVAGNSQTSQTGTWKFFTIPNVPFPAGTTPMSRTYPSVTSNLTGEDYTGLLMGEVSGNWNNTGARLLGRKSAPVGSQRAARTIDITAPQFISRTDNEVVIPIFVRGIADKSVISYEFDLRYDPEVIQPLANPLDVAETVSRGLSAVTNAAEPGRLRVVMYGGYPIDGNGLLLNLRFTAVGAAGSVSPLIWDRIMFNEGDPDTVAIDGQVELSASAPPFRRLAKGGSPPWDRVDKRLVHVN